MGEVQQLDSEKTYLYGSEIRDGRIFAQNRDCNVEERYSVAYNLGCGAKHWTNWINVDVGGDCDLNADLHKLPIESDSADAVAAIHVIEHFYRWEVVNVLTEWKRILKPGGKMILELPCMDKVFAYVLKCIQADEAMMPFITLHAMYGDPKHEDPLMCHKWGWFAEEFRRVLEQVGMREITFYEPSYHFKFRDMRFECIK